MTQVMTSARPIAPFARSRVRRRFDATAVAAVALYVAVVIATAIAVALAAPKIPDIGSLYIAVT